MNVLVVNDGHGLEFEVIRGEVLRLEIVRDTNKVGIQRDLYWRAVINTAQGQASVAVTAIGPKSFAAKTWLCALQEAGAVLTETVTRRYEVGEVVTIAIWKGGKARIIDSTCFDIARVA